jgi:D-beta-D-heptose 7-phosphate kinase/D-beta-D-heptose 1-phosphate adenosyltransferase
MAELSPELATRLNAWRAGGQVVVFTNGVFDLLHAGHIAHLDAARSFGDILVVGLNSDNSARLLGKGDDRPVQDELSRRIILGALRVVDAVAVFDEPTPLELIKLIKPDVLVKGADYGRDEVVGREVVEASGGRVELVPLVQGYSTSAIISRIRGG